MESPPLRRRRKRRSTAARLRRAAAAATAGKERRRRAAGWGAAGRKVRELRALVPGGDGLRAEQFFLHAAGYIVRLRLRLHLLRALSDLYVP